MLHVQKKQGQRLTYIDTHFQILAEDGKAEAKAYDQIDKVNKFKKHVTIIIQLNSNWLYLFPVV